MLVAVVILFVTTSISILHFELATHFFAIILIFNKLNFLYRTPLDLHNLTIEIKQLSL